MYNFELKRNAFGQLVYTSASGETHEGVVPVHAFPITAPEEGISLVTVDGQELAWVDHLSGLPSETRTLIEEELVSREFIPEIQAILHVSTFATPSVWEIETDRGKATLVLKGEDDIRRLNPTSLLIADSHGVHFLVRDIQKLDKASRKLLDRFL